MLLSSTDRRCSYYFWVINNVIARERASHIRGLMAFIFCRADLQELEQSYDCTCAREVSLKDLGKIHWCKTTNYIFKMYIFLRMLWMDPILLRQIEQIWTNWMTFCRIHFEIYFYEWKYQPIFLAKELRPRPRNIKWWHSSWSALGQVMTCCFMAPSHYLTQCWLVIKCVLRHSTRNPQ